MAVFVDIESKRNIKGTFERFLYYLKVQERNLLSSYVYCHTEKDFLKLLRLWNIRCVGKRSIYSYYYKGEHNPVNFDDILADQNRKLKLLLFESGENVEYIQ